MSMKDLGRTVGRIAQALGEKHRRAATLNRIRTVIRCEERAAEKEYQALGRYYYHTLRDKADPVAEPHCARLDEIEAQLEVALTTMQDYCDLYGHEGAEEPLGQADCPEAEEIDLLDIECYDQEPGTEGAAPSEEPAGPEENSTLPFEG